MADKKVSRNNKLSILIIADPGVCTESVLKAKQLINSKLSQRLINCTPKITVKTETILIRPDDSLDYKDVNQHSQRYAQQEDFTFLVTEIPRHGSNYSLVAEVFLEKNLGIISLPTLGGCRYESKITDLALSILSNRFSNILSKKFERPNWVRAQKTEHDSSYKLYPKSRFASLNSIIGMVVTNEPWKTIPQLSSAFASAIGVGAFGIFYSSIWRMADALSVIRLIVVAFIAIILMVAWLTFSNRLWDKPRHTRFSKIIALYNASTLLTLVIVMTALYLGLFLVILFGGLIIIDPSFMRDIMEKDISFWNYLRIAWLSAAMGTIAGAIGSSFDSKADIRHLTHGQRETQRRYAKENDNTQEADTRQ